MVEGGISCWCGSGLPYAQCHGFADQPWILPEVARLDYHWPADMDGQTRTNILNYFASFTPYRLQGAADDIEISCPAYKWEIYRQHLLAIRPDGSPTFLGIPAAYVNWAEAAEPPTPSFVEDNSQALAKIESIHELREFFDFRRRIGHVLFPSRAEDLPYRLRGVVDKFFTFFPGGIVDFVTISRDWKILPTPLRSMVKAEVLGVAGFKETLARGWTSRILSDNPYFDIMFNLFGSGQRGFADTWIDRAILFTFDRSLDFNQVASMLASARGLNQEFWPQPDKQGQPFRSLSFAEFRAFTAWYIARLNCLLSFIHHLASFAEKHGKTLVLHPSHSYKVVLSFDQAIRLVGRILGSDDLFVRKQLTVTLLDLLNHVGGPSGISEVFRDKFVAKVLKLFDGLPPAIRADYTAYAKDVFARVVDDVFEGLAPNLKDGDLVRLRNGSIAKDVYAGRYIAALRNTIHGYLRDPSEDFSELLFINADKLPDSLPDIVPILFLGLLIQPTLFFASRAFGQTLAMPSKSTSSDKGKQ